MYEYEHPRPAVTTDIAVFNRRNGIRSVLLIRRGTDPYRGCWALPGGFVDENEDLTACARRELEEETGLTGVTLEQMHAFGEPGRDPRGHVISVVFLGVVHPERASPVAASDADAVGWFDIDALPELAFDHAAILAMARDRVADLNG